MNFAFFNTTGVLKTAYVLCNKLNEIEAEFVVLDSSEEPQCIFSVYTVKFLF